VKKRSTNSRRANYGGTQIKRANDITVYKKSKLKKKVPLRVVGFLTTNNVINFVAHIGLTQQKKRAIA